MNQYDIVEIENEEFVVTSILPEGLIQLLPFDVGELCKVPREVITLIAALAKFKNDRDFTELLSGLELKSVKCVKTGKVRKVKNEPDIVMNIDF